MLLLGLEATQTTQNFDLQLTLRVYCERGFHLASRRVGNNLCPASHIVALELLGLAVSTLRDESRMAPQFLAWQMGWCSESLAHGTDRTRGKSSLALAFEMKVGNLQHKVYRRQLETFIFQIPSG